MFLEFNVERKCFLTFISSNKMDTSLRSLSCWILTTLLIFASMNRSGAISWKTRPGDSIDLVLGHNNTNVELEWTWNLEGATFRGIVFQRQRVGKTERTQIASRTEPPAFTVPGQFDREYEARSPATLKLIDVSNQEEYLYTIVLSYLSTSGVLKFYDDQVTVIVHVPPKITKREPEGRLVVNAGQSKNLTCEASGDPKPNITWTREGFTKAQFNASGNQLHLGNIQKKDIGGYKCTADNGYGTATGLFIININCRNQCKELRVGMRIRGPEGWKDAYGNTGSIEFKTLETKLTSEIVALYNRLPENDPQKLYQVSVEEFREGSIKAILKMQFQEGNNNTLLQPLREAILDETLGPFTVDKQLELNPTDPPDTTPSGQTPTPTNEDPNAGARGSTSKLSDGALAGIIAGCAAFVIVIIIIIIVCCIKKRKQAGASKSKYTEADGYRMNRQPPPSGLGTASPAYVEARMYAPANASKKQDDQPKPLNYADLSLDKSGKPPPRYGSGTEYSEMSPEKRPPPAGGQGGGGQGEGGFELWC